MTNLLPLDNFYPVTLCRRVRKKKKATNYCIRFGHSLRSANQLPTQGEILVMEKDLYFRLWPGYVSSLKKFLLWTKIFEIVGYGQVMCFL